MEFLHWFIFIQIVSQIVEIENDCDKKYCND